MRMLRRLMHSTLIILAILYSVLILAALFSDRLIFQPQRSSYTDAQLRNTIEQALARNPSLHAELIKLQSGPGHKIITALYVPAPSKPERGAAPANGFTLLFSHGNAEDIGDNLPFFDMLINSGFAVFAYDYRGYGTSEDLPTERGVYQDVDAAYQYLTTELHVPPSRIISFGRSVGCGAALAVTQPGSRPSRDGMGNATHRVAGVILESPFTSAFRVLTRVPLLPFDKFNNLRLMPHIHVPVLIIHGRRDQVIPFSHGQRIFDAANPPKQNLWIDDAGHNDVAYTGGHAYFHALQSFASTLPK